MMSSVEIHNTKKEEIEKVNNEIGENKNESQNKYYCSVKQLLIIVVPITAVLLFAAIFVPVYIMEKKNDDDDEKPVENNIYYYENQGHDEFEETIINDTYAILTPKYGYDNILIFLGGISDVSTKYWDFFKSRETFVPIRTKIYFLSGQKREMQFMIDYYKDPRPYCGWFNIDKFATLRPTPGDFTEAKKSLKLVLDEIDRIKTVENVDYKKIYLSGFSQGAMMTNYILLNSRFELGGYIAFSGYVFDHDFSENTVIYDMSEQQKSKIEARKNYHILATHSFSDDAVFYQLSAESYRFYYQDYTDFKLLSFGNLRHVFPEQPIHPYVRKWLKESMER